MPQCLLVCLNCYFCLGVAIRIFIFLRPFSSWLRAKAKGASPEGSAFTFIAMRLIWGYWRWRSFLYLFMNWLVFWAVVGVIVWVVDRSSSCGLSQHNRTKVLLDVVERVFQLLNFGTVLDCLAVVDIGERAHLAIVANVLQWCTCYELAIGWPSVYLLVAWSKICFRRSSSHQALPPATWSVLFMLCCTSEDDSIRSSRNLNGMAT